VEPSPLAVEVKCPIFCLSRRPLDAGTGGGLINVEIMLAAAANLELARTLLALGYPEIGLQAVVRRPYHAGLWGVFGFHNEFLLEEARLWAASGNGEAALDRYDRYFRLRPTPPDLAAWRATWERAQAEREALLSRRTPRIPPADGREPPARGS
jgi:hypothetical protein